MRVLRLAGLLLLVGAAAGVAARKMLPSRGDAESDEVELNAVIHGETLKSRAQAFRGGTVRAWFGGVAIDLREATLAPGARLEVSSLLGGIAIRVPPGWRVETDVDALAGGVAVDVPEPEDPAAPVLRIEGRTVLGGLAVGAKPPAE
jgi:hypothetical protein